MQSARLSSYYPKLQLDYASRMSGTSSCMIHADMLLIFVCKNGCIYQCSDLMKHLHLQNGVQIPPCVFK